MIFILFLVPLLVLIFFSYSQIHRTLTDLTLSRRQAVAVPTAIALKERLDRLVDFGVTLSIHPRLRDAVMDQKWGEAIEVLEVFKTISNDPYVERFFITDPAGILKADTPAIGTIGQDFSFRDWYQGVMRTGKAYVSEVYQRSAEPRHNVIGVATPVIDDDQKLAAIIVLQVKLDWFRGWTGGVEIGSGGFIYVVDQYGHVVAHPKFMPQDQIIDFSEVETVKKVLAERRGIEILPDSYENRVMLAAYEAVPVYNWGVVVAQPAKSAFAPRNGALMILVVIYGLIFLFYVFLVNLVLRSIAHFQHHRD